MVSGYILQNGVYLTCGAFGEPGVIFFVGGKNLAFFMVKYRLVGGVCFEYAIIHLNASITRFCYFLKPRVSKKNIFVN